MFILPKSNYIITLAFLVIMLLPSCRGCEEPQEETKKVITQEEEEIAPMVQEGQRPALERSEGIEESEELKGIMASASRHMKTLENALGEENWAIARDSSKILEDLIGRQCVNAYIKVNKDVSQDFVQISQRFNDAVLRLLVAEGYQDAPLALSQFKLMQEGCQECHKKYRKEQSAPGG
ncbi:MAG TPA: hypothetical protein ACFYD3_05185 [Candidatus Hypogeohydataceae bacterium YC41]